MRQPTFNSQTGDENDYQNDVNPNRSARQTAEHLKQAGSMMRNARSVWTIPTQPFHGAHTAAFPPELVKPCILAGCPEGGTDLDSFLGSGTTGLVAESPGRRWIGIGIHPAYAEMARKRIEGRR